MMRRLIQTLVLGATLTAAPAAILASESAQEVHGETAHAEGTGHNGHEAHLDWKTFALQTLNFGVLLAILLVYGGKAMNKALAARHEQLKTDIEAATKARNEAEQKLRVQSERMVNLETELQALRASIKQDAEAEAARLVAVAEERAGRIREETKFLLDQQVRAAEEQLRREAAEKALAVAEELLRKTIQPRDQQRLVASFIKDLPAEKQ